MFWIVFKNKNTGKELCAYTITGSFSGELEATKEMLAYENGIDVTEIEITIERRKK